MLNLYEYSRYIFSAVQFNWEANGIAGSRHPEYSYRLYTLHSNHTSNEIVNLWILKYLFILIYLHLVRVCVCAWAYSSPFYYVSASRGQGEWLCEENISLQLHILVNLVISEYWILGRTTAIHKDTCNGHYVWWGWKECMEMQ